MSGNRCAQCSGRMHGDGPICYRCLVAKKRAEKNCQTVERRCQTCGANMVLTWRQRDRRYCEPCAVAPASRSWHSTITNMVHGAVSLGLLPKLDGSVPCIDCGKPATDYDHRDYNKPLDVEPTCRSCNIKRGPAIPLWAKE